MSVIDFPKVKFPRENYYGYVKKNKRITNDSSRVKFYGLKNTQSGSTNHEKEECTTCCTRAELVLAPNPNRSSKTQQDFDRCCECVTLTS